MVARQTWMVHHLRDDLFWLLVQVAAQQQDAHPRLCRAVQCLQGIFMSAYMGEA